MRSTVLRTTPALTAYARAHPFARSVTQPDIQRQLTKMSVAEEGLGKTTSDEKWKELLTAEEYQVIRQKGTERPGTGEYNKFQPTGGYFACRACNAKLYDASHKFDSGCGWPAFYDNVPDTVERVEDNMMGMKRVEILCKNCGGHLGHVFAGEGFKNPKDERHCVNSVSIKYVKE